MASPEKARDRLMEILTQKGINTRVTNSSLNGIEYYSIKKGNSAWFFVPLIQNKIVSRAEKNYDLSKIFENLGTKIVPTKMWSNFETEFFHHVYVDTDDFLKSDDATQSKLVDFFIEQRKKLVGKLA